MSSTETLPQLSVRLNFTYFTSVSFTSVTCCLSGYCKTRQPAQLGGGMSGAGYFWSPSQVQQTLPLYGDLCCLNIPLN